MSRVNPERDGEEVRLAIYSQEYDINKLIPDMIRTHKKLKTNSLKILIKIQYDFYNKRIFSSIFSQ